MLIDKLLSTDCNYIIFVCQLGKSHFYGVFMEVLAVFNDSISV